MSDPNDSAQRILDGRAWADFCDALKRAGDVVLRPGSPLDAFDRAEGFRYLSRLTRVALESYIEFADPLFPVLRRPAHETVKIGADNPDNYYQSAAISGAARVPDHRHAQHRALPGPRHLCGLLRLEGAPRTDRLPRRARDEDRRRRQLRDHPLAVDEQPGTNWLRMEPDTSSLIVRQTFQDRAHETIADLSIERLGGTRTPEPVTPGASSTMGSGGGRLRRRNARRSSRTGPRASRST